MNLPQARKDNLLTTQLEDEVVVYDPERKQAHSLNRTALAVWKHSDGQTSISDLQRRASAEVGLPISEAAIWLALRKLERAHLLLERIGSSDGMTRRQVFGQAGRLGAAAMVATPLVLTTAVLPAAAQTSACPPTGTPQCAPLCVCFAPITGGARQCAAQVDGLACTNPPTVGFTCPTGSICVSAGGSTTNGTCHNTLTCLPAVQTCTC
jgi:hypothetical protein